MDSKTTTEGMIEGDVDALGPLALLRQSFMNGSMTPAQLSSTVDKMSSELKVYKDMADYYQNQVTQLNQGLPPSGQPKPRALASAPSSTIPASVSLRTVVLNPPDFKAALHSHLSNAERHGSPGIRFQNGGKSIVLEDGRILPTCEVMQRVCKAYLESLTVVSCKDAAIPLPESDMAEKFVLLCQALSFNDQRAPEDCHEPGPEAETNILTSEDAPLEVLIDLWEHAVVFCGGSFTLGGRMDNTTSSTPGSSSSSSTPSPGAPSPNTAQNGTSSSTNAPSTSATPAAQTSSRFSAGGYPETPKTPLSVAIADSGTTYQSIFGTFGFGSSSSVAAPSGAQVPSTPTGTSAALSSSALTNAMISIFSTNCEKLMRVIIFRREAHVIERYAERLVRCLMGTSVHYRNVNKLGAASSLLMIAHQVIAMFPSVIPPVMSDRIYVLLLLGASTEHERTEWLHMLHDQIHFTTSILLSFNVGFIVSKLRTHPVMTKPVWEEISSRLTELESLLPTLKPDVPLFQVWVKILIACFHGELGARIGDMDRAALALSRIEQLVMDNYSSSLAIVLLAELRNFAANCSPCSVVLNGKEQVLCHYVIDRIQAIHDEMSCAHDAAEDLACKASSRMEESESSIDAIFKDSAAATTSQVPLPTVSSFTFDYANSRAPEGSPTVSPVLSAGNTPTDGDRADDSGSKEKQAKTANGRPLNFVPNNAPIARSRPVPHVYPPPISSKNWMDTGANEDQDTFEAFRSTVPQPPSATSMATSQGSSTTLGANGIATARPGPYTGRLPPLTTNPLDTTPTPVPTKEFEAAVNGYETGNSTHPYEGQAFTESTSVSSGPVSFESDWDYERTTADPEMLLSNWSASHNRLNAELFGFADNMPFDESDLSSNN